jgi:hypothetical protein
MSLDFSGVDTQSGVNALDAKLRQLEAEMTTLAGSAAVSDQGRSIDFGAAMKANLEQQKMIREQLILMAGPAFVTSRMRA